MLPSQLAVRLNVAPQVVTNWASRGISDKGMLEIEEATGIRALWLKTGVGNELVLTPETQQWAGLFQTASPDAQRRAAAALIPNEEEAPPAAAKQSTGRESRLAKSVVHSDNETDFGANEGQSRRNWEQK